jgi:hypothetical protein
VGCHVRNRIRQFIFPAFGLSVLATLGWWNESYLYQQINILTIGEKAKSALIGDLHRVFVGKQISPVLLYLPGFQTLPNSERSTERALNVKTKYSGGREWTYFKYNSEMSSLDLIFDEVCITKSDINQITDYRAGYLREISLHGSPPLNSFVAYSALQSPISLKGDFDKYGCALHIFIYGPR